MKGFLETLFGGLSLEEKVDPRLPSGFVSLFLASRANLKPLLFISQSLERLSLVSDELESFPEQFPRPVWIDGPDWEKRLPLVGNSILLSLKGKVTEEEVKSALTRVGHRIVREGDTLERDRFLELLVDLDYERVGYVELPGEVAWRGSVVDFFPWGARSPRRIEFFGDKIISLREFDPETQRSVLRVQMIAIPKFGGKEEAQDLDVVVEEITERGPKVVPLPSYHGNLELMERDIERLKKRGYEVFFTTRERWRMERFKNLLRVEFLPLGLHQGFIFEDRGIAVFTENQLIGRLPRRRKAMKLPFAQRIEDPALLNPGDIVVHRDYGIARYLGLKMVTIQGSKYDCLVLQYKDGEVLVPSYNLDDVQRYVGGDVIPPLSEIASPSWANRKARAVISAMKLAEELLELHAKRKAMRGFSFSKDTLEQKELEAGFPYLLTPDQERVIEEVKKDMESPKAMDRLIAGEVGFGKTEVALRAAFKAVMDLKQVVVLVPTTILALQHFQTFVERLKNFPVRVEMVSRLRSQAEIKKILKDLKEGRVDIVIGTHRLLLDDVQFHDLGLLIIDEEHRFGVLQKERIRRKYLTVDTLKMTATPIPRTLYAALGKILDLSFIETPPEGRQDVETIVLPYDKAVIKEAIERELEREGQVFYVFNRVENIEEVKRTISDLVPGARVACAHGKMPKSRLERVFLDFLMGKVDVLVTTAIIESGIDFPKANTLIVERPDLFGLAELHQLRGRVGRSHLQAYAYFMMPKKVSRKALKRLEALLRYHHLGSGLKIALMDMEIRGAGNLLGIEQHGHAKQLGYELYFQLLEEALHSYQRGETPPKPPEILLRGFPAYIPPDYIEESEIRVAFYRKISKCRSLREILELKDELEDRFGLIPDEARNLLLLVFLGLKGQEDRVHKIVVSPERVRLYTAEGERVYRWEVLMKKWDGINEILGIDSHEPSLSQL